MHRGIDKKVRERVLGEGEVEFSEHRLGWQFHFHRVIAESSLDLPKGRLDQVARVMPIERASADLIGALSGRITVKGDITSTGLTWEAGD